MYHDYNSPIYFSPRSEPDDNASFLNFGFLAPISLKLTVRSLASPRINAANHVKPSFLRIGGQPDTAKCGGLGLITSISEAPRFSFDTFGSKQTPRTPILYICRGSKGFRFKLHGKPQRFLFRIHHMRNDVG